MAIDAPQPADNGHPPRCPVVFHVGITGHRRLPKADLARLNQTIAAILAEVRARAAAIVEAGLAADEPLIRSDPARLRLFSSLAAGADSLVAEEALKLGYELHAPFPFARAVYGDDFKGEEAAHWTRLTAHATAVFELDGDRGHIGHAYLAAGRVVLDQSDLLIAVWDGEEARGIGGTEEIVEEAAERKLPVLVVDAAAPHGVHFLDGAGEDWRARLGREMDRILAPFADPSDWRGFPWAYFRETRKARGGDSAMAWTNALAKHYAHCFRTAALVRYVFAVAVVAGTFIGFYFGRNEQPLGFAIQAVAVLAILALTFAINRAKWQQRMLDYRFLAEHLRHCASLAALGYVLPATRYPTHQASEEAIWVNWYFRGLNRLSGLPNGALDAQAMTALRERAVADIESQKTWYHARSQHCRRYTRILTAIGLATFIPGIVMIALRAVGFGVTIWGNARLVRLLIDMDPEPLRRLLNEIALVLPALAPIVFGLLSLAEYPRIGERYAAMSDYLGKAVADLRRTAPRRRRILPKLVAITTVMLAEVSDWRVLIKSKTLPRP